ncbi:MAG: hypothetical protein ACIAXF_09345 [Phycisphaerales bacterium JB063]
MLKRWKRMRGLGLLLAAVVLLAGCSTRNYLRKADEAAEHGDMRSALHYYERALSSRGSLADDDDFVQKLRIAQSRVAFEDAVALRGRGHFEASARKLHESLDYDPGFGQAVELLGVVNAQAASQRYDQALASADRGDLNAANEHLRIAQAHDTSNEDVVAAMASLRLEVLPANTPGLAPFEAGLTRSGERRWDAAAGLYRESIGLNRNMLPARAALAEANAQLAESRRLSDSGAARIRESRISAAIPILENALAVWPFNEPAQASLTQARGVLAEADAKFSQAVAAGEASDWDGAIAAAEAGLVLDQSHARLRDLRPQLGLRAATDYTQRGAGHADAGELEAARDAFLRALSYKHPHSPAQRGLADVYLAWGRSHEQAGRVGAALLHYNRGQTYMATSGIAEGRSRTLAAIYGGLEMTLDVEAGETPLGLAVSGDRLGEALRQRAQRSAPAGLSVRSDQPRFVLEAEVAEARISQQLVNTTTRSHQYYVDEPRPNPEYARLVDRLNDYQRQLDRLERDYHSHVGPNHGHHHHDPHTPENNHLNRLVQQMETKQRQISQTSRQLRNTPATVLVPISHTYRYTVETYAKIGSLTVASRLIDTATGEVIETFTDEASFEDSDTTIRDARPEIGLRPDALHLADDSTIAGSLAHDAAQRTTQRAIESAVMYELDRVRAFGAQQLEAGRADAALEIEVAAALLIGMVDADASGRVLDRLGEANVE